MLEESWRELETSWRRVGELEEIEWRDSWESYCKESVWSCFRSHTGYDMSGAAKPPPHTCRPNIVCSKSSRGTGMPARPLSAPLSQWQPLSFQKLQQNRKETEQKKKGAVITKTAKKMPSALKNRRGVSKHADSMNQTHSSKTGNLISFQFFGAWCRWRHGCHTYTSAH